MILKFGNLLINISEGENMIYPENVNQNDKCCYQICLPKQNDQCNDLDASFKSNKLRRSIFVHNAATRTLLYTFLTFFIATCFALYQEIFATELDELYAVDYWSVAHTFYCFGFYCINSLLYKIL